MRADRCQTQPGADPCKVRLEEANRRRAARRAKLRCECTLRTPSRRTTSRSTKKQTLETSEDLHRRRVASRHHLCVNKGRIESGSISSPFRALGFLGKYVRIVMLCTASTIRLNCELEYISGKTKMAPPKDARTSEKPNQELACTTTKSWCLTRWFVLCDGGDLSSRWRARPAPVLSRAPVHVDATLESHKRWREEICDLGSVSL